MSPRTEPVGRKVEPVGRLAKPVEYQCSNGHWQMSTRKHLDGCQAYVLGQPCTGTLRRVGAGSRAANAATNNITGGTN